MTPFQEELYRLIQDIKKESNAFTSAAEDAGSETNKIIKFSQKWDFKEKFNDADKEKEDLKEKLAKDRQIIIEKITKSLVKELVPIIDELFTLSNFTASGSPVERGIKLTLSNFEKFLERRDGGIIKPNIGEVLNPKKHQAVSAEQDPSHYGNTISEVYRFGYYVLNQVVREAEVKVKCGVSEPL